jgi:hypothetical protein
LSTRGDHPANQVLVLALSRSTRPSRVTRSVQHLTEMVAVAQAPRRERRHRTDTREADAEFAHDRTGHWVKRQHLRHREGAARGGLKAAAGPGNGGLTGQPRSGWLWPPSRSAAGERVTESALLERLVTDQERTAELVEGLSRDENPQPAGQSDADAGADTSARQLSAMTAPPYDSSEIEAMRTQSNAGTRQHRP